MRLLRYHTACVNSLTRRLIHPSPHCRTRFSRPPLARLARLCTDMSTTTTTTITSSTSTGVGALTDACCEPGSASTYPAHLSFPPGKEVKYGGVDCYSVNEQSTHIVIYSTDVFGWRHANNRQNAEQIAASGFHVVMPDMFDGNAVTAEQVKEKGMQWVQTEWLSNNPREERAAVLATVVVDLKQKHNNTAGTQAVGYCYGAPGVLLLYGKGLVSAGVVAHPSGFTKDNVALCHKPTLFNCAETDPAFTPDIRQHWQQTLGKSSVPTKFVDYPGTLHGFAVRDDGSAVGVAARQSAIQETVAWLKQHSS